MIKTAKRLQDISEYIFSQLNKEAKIVEKSSGKRVLNFAVGNPDIKPSQKYLHKLKDFFLEDDVHLYPGYGATLNLSDALIAWYKKRFAVTLDKNELLPLLGAKDGIAHITFALFDKGDEVLIPNPGYPAYAAPVKLIGAVPVFYDLKEEDDFKLNLSSIKEKITSKTKAIWINFPSNPTGQIITREELEKLIALAKQNNILALFDNAYSEITFDGYKAPSILQIKGAKDVAIEFGSFSKSFSFAGFRMGWAVGNEQVIAALAKVKTHMDSGLALPLQRLGAYALTNTDKKWHDEMIATYQKRREIVAQKLTQLGLTFTLPKATLYIWAKIPPTEKNSGEFCHRILKEKQILLTPGTAFGSSGERYVRVSIGIDISKIEEYFT